MNRKQFLGTVGAALAAPADAQTTQPDSRRKFEEQWIAALMDNLKSRLDAAAGIAVMENCGRACARRGAVASIATPAERDIQRLLDRLANHIGKDNARREGDTVHLTYPKCYCPMVAAGPPRLPDLYCECSRGWLLEVFEAVAGKPVKVEIVQTIKRGADSCRFTVRL